MSSFFDWVSGKSNLLLLGSLFGFIIAQFIIVYTFSEQQKTVKEIEMINLARNLSSEFYQADDRNTVFMNLRVAIEKCEKLYKGYDKQGRFNNDQINRYLGFFDDLGLFYKRGALDLDIIKQLFGTYIIEAYEYNEVRKYIEELRKNSKQPGAFENFQYLGEQLEKHPEFKELIAESRLGCFNKSKN